MVLHTWWPEHDCCTDVEIEGKDHVGTILLKPQFSISSSSLLPLLLLNIPFLSSTKLKAKLTYLSAFKVPREEIASLSSAKAFVDIPKASTEAFCLGIRSVEVINRTLSWAICHRMCFLL